MANEILKGIAEDMKEVDVAITEARDLVSAMKEAGEDVSALESDMRDLEIRKVKWDRMLKSRGVT
ncbi:MAG: hypothetical protein FVQ79_12175 [Planctomycetes bacterium]|nr:hypothetical protein [Planctomycetota bacterium]